MSKWTMIVLLTAAACASRQTPSETAEPRAPEETKAVLELRAAADAVCACADDTCAQAALERLLEREAELQNPIDQVGLDAEHDRAVDCYSRKTGVPRAAELVPVMEQAAAEVCACSDEPCARRVVERLKGALAAKKNAVFTTGDQAALEAAGQRLQDCAARLSAAPGAAPPPAPPAPPGP